MVKLILFLMFDKGCSGADTVAMVVSGYGSFPHPHVRALDSRGGAVQVLPARGLEGGTPGVLSGRRTQGGTAIQA